MAKRKPKTDPIAAASGKTPSVVLGAFAPGAQARYDMRGWLLLESIGSPIVRGLAPNYRDTVVAYLILRDSAAVEQACKRGKLDAMVDEYTANRSPAELVAYMEAVKTAVAAAFNPVNDPSQAGAEKKSSADAAGG